MAVIYTKKDRVKVRLKDVELQLAPLNFAQKAEIQELALSKDIKKMNMSVFKAIKYSLKDVKGLQLPHGAHYELEFDESGLSDECVDDMLNFSYGNKIADIIGQMVNGVPEEFINVSTGEKMQDVEILGAKSEKKSKASS